MKVSINTTIVDKAETKEEFAVLTKTFKNIDCTQKELANLIDRGHAFCAQHKDSYRKSANFTAAGFVAVDIDTGMQIEEALEHPFVKKYGSIFYTTPSHTDEHHRFRIVFETERTISDAMEMKNAYRGIIKKFGGDPSCNDACRLFFGSKDSNPTVFGNTMPNAELEELISLGAESNRHSQPADKEADGDRPTIRSTHTVDEDTPVWDEDGQQHRLGDLEPGIRIRCPVHIDTKPSAVTLRSKAGIAGLYCSACAATYFVQNDTPTYSFDYGLQALHEYESQEWEIVEDEHGLCWEEVPIMRVSERFLPDVRGNAAVTLVKSPKGTGKTQWLERIVRECERRSRSALIRRTDAS